MVLKLEVKVGAVFLFYHHDYAWSSQELFDRQPLCSSVCLSVVVSEVPSPGSRAHLFGHCHTLWRSST